MMKSGGECELDAPIKFNSRVLGLMGEHDVLSRSRSPSLPLLPQPFRQRCSMFRAYINSIHDMVQRWVRRSEMQDSSSIINSLQMPVSSEARRLCDSHTYLEVGGLKIGRCSIQQLAWSFLLVSSFTFLHIVHTCVRCWKQRKVSSTESKDGNAMMISVGEMLEMFVSIDFEWNWKTH